MDLFTGGAALLWGLMCVGVIEGIVIRGTCQNAISSSYLGFLMCALMCATPCVLSAHKLTRGWTEGVSCFLMGKVRIAKPCSSKKCPACFRLKLLDHPFPDERIQRENPKVIKLFTQKTSTSTCRHVEEGPFNDGKYFYYQGQFQC